MILAYILIIICLALTTRAQLTGYTSSETLNRISSKAATFLASPKSLEEAYHSALLLNGLKALKGSCKCDQISSLLKGNTDGMDIFYGIETSSLCGCPAIKVSSETKKSLIAASQVTNILDIDVSSYFNSL